MLECWNIGKTRKIGIVKHWNIGLRKNVFPIIPIFHDSIIPTEIIALFHYSTIPIVSGAN